MTQGKLLEFLSDIGISISAGQLSNLLIKEHQTFHTEKQEVYQAGLASSPWQHIDQTSARVGGENQTCNVVCNPFFTVYHTTAKKDRLTVLDMLQGGIERQFLLNEKAFALMKTFNIPQKLIARLQQLPFATRMGAATFLEQLHSQLPTFGKIQLFRICEAAASHSQPSPLGASLPTIIRHLGLLCRPWCAMMRPNSSYLAVQLALCWVDEGRHYKKLTPATAFNQLLLEHFLDCYWDYYDQLLQYRQPSVEAAELLRQQFQELFATTTGYWELDERIKLTSAKKSELLLVLEHPEIPLHNNSAELGARTMVRRRIISYGTQTAEGTQAWDTFLSLVATTRQLGISFFEYVRDAPRGLAREGSH